jgi:hypothetical protein
MSDARLKQLLLMLFSSEYDGEMATARNMIVASLKKDGHDIHWLADLVSRGGVTNGGGNADYLKGFRDGTATASTTSRATSSEVQRAFASGQRAGYDAGYKTGFAEAGAVARSRQAPGWTPEWGSDPTVYDGADPEPGSTMPAQAWAAWLLTRRRQQLTQWEMDFCRSIARWRGETTEKQKIHLQDVIRKVRR